MDQKSPLLFGILSRVDFPNLNAESFNPVWVHSEYRWHFWCVCFVHTFLFSCIIGKKTKQDKFSDVNTQKAISLHVNKWFHHHSAILTLCVGISIILVVGCVATLSIGLLNLKHHYTQFQREWLTHLKTRSEYFPTLFRPRKCTWAYYGDLEKSKML